METLKNTRGNDLGHSKNGRDWIIRSELLRAYWIAYGERSTTLRLSVGGMPDPSEGLRYSLADGESYRV